LRAAQGTDPGRERENNEDRVLCDPERGIYAVIDGVGGESGGEVAAQTALDVLRSRLSRRTTDLDRLVREAIALANRQIYERALADPRLAGMSCVLTVAMLDGDHATVGHVGDSRLYRLRRGEIRKMTRDHSPVGAREDAGELSEDEAMHHPRRNEIFRDVGSAPHEPDDEGFIDVQRVPFAPDDALLLCSDGLSDLVPAARIREIVEAHAGDPQAAIGRLIQEANGAGGKDNVSIVLVEGGRYAASLSGARPAAGTTPSPYGAAHVRTPLGRRLLRWALLLLLLAAAAVVFLSPGLRQQIAGLAGLAGAPTPAPPAPISPTPPPVLRVGPGEIGFATISEALATARPGQTVEVEPGDYREAIALRDGVDLVSRVPRGAVLRAPQGATIPVVSARGVKARLAGFRIAGNATTPLTVGLRLDGAQVQATGLEVLGATEAGIEIAGEDRSTIETSYVHDNAGAGVVVADGAAPQIRQNLIARNGIPGNGMGKKRPGVEVRGAARPLLIENRIEGNAAAGVWLPSAERADEIFGWNRFEGTPRAKAVQVAPRQAAPPAATPATSATPGPGR
jgi:serine/threonine protein phosphatase PrpC